MLTLDIISTSECYYCITGQACLVLSANVKKGSASNNYKQSAPKVLKAKDKNKQNQ